ncbi:ribonuclease E/G [Algimonas porphyrae]|uniref:RNA-binding protein AU-1/Ribonuclease E/G domain-containing protein n=1 Tax=Algimonas porphyrae TaxID=1128113 RepID=A0ABQ5UVZ1_9PROT|nr:ribonuclease E/G [Algimonas porphyrae]GLQ19059.1 hypothetical protein GCM10007854_00140 [Algimonas porphyrae]
MKRRAVIEDCIGETRAAVYEGRKLVELHLDRWSDFNTPRIGERWTGQVTSIDPSVGGLWLELGKGPSGLLTFKAQKDLPRLTEGALIDVIITKEAMSEKGPTLRYVGDPSRDKPGAVTVLSLQQRLESRFPDIGFEDSTVGVMDMATERQLAVPGGGTVTLERTQALIAVDVDKGGAKTVMDCSTNAASLIMSQLRLRGLGGLVAVDFPNMRQSKHRSTLIRLLEEAGEADPASVRVAPFSRFGVVEMTRGQDGPSIDAKMNDRFGRPTIETQSIQALRRLTREARAAPGARLTLSVTPDIRHWLDDCPFDWRTPLTERIGARFTLDEGNAVDVRGDR